MAILVTGFYTWFGNSIPQTAWEAPKKKVFTADMSPMDLSKDGQEIFKTAGCGVCHSVTGAQLRGPDLSRAGATLDPDSMAALLYMGTQVMPPANKPPANLNNSEITAVIAYLQSLGGKPSVKIGDIKPIQ
ncbi:Cytochrome c, class I domain protein [Candidatus Magnetoovum chiemensis]|nr:Cytochrome c, class I domain protein [Candidatus Magnetoovum chiemensis]